MEAFDAIRNRTDIERVFLENNCSTSLVGDDLAGIAAKANLSWPVYTMDSGGLNGSFEGGYEKAFLVVIDQMEKQGKTDNSVNVLGLSEVYLKGKEDALEIKRLLKKSGISVISMPGAGENWETLLKAPSAALNIIVREELALKAAEKMKDKFGIPYISLGMPYGIDGTLQWIKKILEKLDIENDNCRKEAEQRKEKMFYKGNNLQSLWGPLWFTHVLIAAPPSEAVGIAEAVRSEWLDTENLIIHMTAKSSYFTEAADAVRLVGIDDREIKKDYENWSEGLVMGSSHESARLFRLDKKFMSCNIARPSSDEIFVTDTPLCGLRGAEYLYERLWNLKVREKMKDKNQ